MLRNFKSQAFVKSRPKLFPKKSPHHVFFQFHVYISTVSITACFMQHANDSKRYATHLPFRCDRNPLKVNNRVALVAGASALVVALDVPPAAAW